MPFYIVRNDITGMDADAIVNAANNELQMGGGVCGAIFSAAGEKELTDACNRIGFCRTGDAVITKGFRLKAGHIIHTPGPVWQGGGFREEELLRSSYRNSLLLAKENNLESIAFPLISSGIYGYPHEEAFRIASEEITGFLKDHDMTVHLVLYDNESFRVGKSKFPDIEEFITQRYIPEGYDYRRVLRKQAVYNESADLLYEESSLESKAALAFRLMETFQEMLFRKIDELKLKDSSVYRKANIDRRLFSKIRSNKDYIPSKDTAIALGIALELNRVELNELLGKAGYALSRSLMSDVIIEYCIEKGIYDIHEINEFLFERTGRCLGNQ